MHLLPDDIRAWHGRAGGSALPSRGAAHDQVVAFIDSWSPRWEATFHADLSLRIRFNDQVSEFLRAMRSGVSGLSSEIAS